ncbi:disulfide bond formation protein B [Paenibacillus sp. SYP-B3998]|uniref:Disulfide bond formation protein B n=1 Tax=Paenibacillus sp. SYP-B3998 TaxID=2678564 RepID=A0A6G4A3C2_9BACL|nr:disulfide oxidoreductase [Paenibacillus sp. SYP-B3998]NEW08788.1 disulfide bond formation protein B [Paenibacillus sp. SYP-B3998]
MSNKWIKDNGMYISWFIALIATLGSLYFSEIMNFLPCKLCWYQRILMYPLVILLGIAAVRRDYKLTIYALPLTIWGACISIYHVLLQSGVFHEDATACGPVPCDVDYLNWFGFITIPMLAGTAFILITIFQFLTYRATK